MCCRLPPNLGKQQCCSCRCDVFPEQQRMLCCAVLCPDPHPQNSDDGQLEAEQSMATTHLRLPIDKPAKGEGRC